MPLSGPAQSIRYCLRPDGASAREQSPKTLQFLCHIPAQQLGKVFFRVLRILLLRLLVHGDRCINVLPEKAL